MEKQPLTKNPFVKEFEYGAASERYWTYQHMVLQLEDCINVLNVLYPQYDYLFLFDHSCRHDKQREDGLNVENMSKSFGGQQAKMRLATIKQENRYLGANPQILNPDSTQFMVFQTQDTAPFWMTEQHQEAQ